MADQESTPPPEKSEPPRRPRARTRPMGAQPPADEPTPTVPPVEPEEQRPVPTDIVTSIGMGGVQSVLPSPLSLLSNSFRSALLWVARWVSTPLFLVAIVLILVFLVGYTLGFLVSGQISAQGSLPIPTKVLSFGDATAEVLVESAVRSAYAAATTLAQDATATVFAQATAAIQARATSIANANAAATAQIQATATGQAKMTSTVAAYITTASQMAISLATEDANRQLTATASDRTPVPTETPTVTDTHTPTSDATGTPNAIAEETRAAIRSSIETQPTATPNATEEFVAFVQTRAFEITATALMQAAEAEKATVIAQATSTAAAQLTTVPRPTRTPSPAPTRTPTPTRTRVPTQTPTSTVTPIPAPQPVDGLVVGQPFVTSRLADYKNAISVSIQVNGTEQAKETVERIEVQANLTFAGGVRRTWAVGPITALNPSASMTIPWADGISIDDLGRAKVELVFTPIDNNQIRRASITRSLDLVACSFQLSQRRSSYWNVTRGGSGPQGNDPTYMGIFESNTLVCLIGRADCPASPNPIVKLVTEDTLDQGKDGWTYAFGSGFRTFDSAAIDGLPLVPPVGPPSCALP